MRKILLKTGGVSSVSESPVGDNLMKRYCKNVKIVDRGVVRRAIFDCLKGKWRRGDVLKLFMQYDPYRRPKAEMKRLLYAGDKLPLFAVIESIADGLMRELTERKVVLQPIRYKSRYDTSCHKWREIGVQDVKQQILDYVAVEGLRDIFRRIGEYQCASVPGRGQSYGIRAVKRWLKDRRIKYAWKGDIRHCFPSISRENMMAFLRRYVANDDLLWLVDMLLGTFREGLSIGSYLSQWLCNLYLSQLYHFAAEQCHGERRGKKLPMAQHVLFYMDDILLLGTNKKNLLMLARRMEDEAKSIGLEIKPDWRLWQLNDEDFIDIMGVRVYRHHIAIRARVFLRLRRALKEAGKAVRLRGSMALRTARRVAAYFGLLKHTDSYGVARRFSLWRSLGVAKEVIGNGSVLCYEAA